MSNRTIDQINELAELKLSHELQIEALTAPGLSDEERVGKFGEAAGFSEEEVATLCLYMQVYRFSLARSVWQNGSPQRSLFADLPGCLCPVHEVRLGRAKYPGIPSKIPDDWRPTRSVLKTFARVQQEARS